MEPVPESVNAIAGVDSRFTVASAVILYAGPAFSLFLSTPLLSQPVLQLLVFSGALFGLFSLLIPGIIALGLADGSSDVSVSNMQTLFESRGLLVAFDCILHDVMRLLLVYLIIKGERFFRRNGQVMYHSNIRLLPLGASAGFGFGFLRGLCVIASSASVAMDVETTTSNAGFVRNSPTSLGVYVNLDSCSVMPLLVQQSASHLFAFFGDILWTLLCVPFVAGIMLKDDNSSMVNNNNTSNSSSPTTTYDSTASSSASTVATAGADQKRKEKEKDPRWYEPTTTTTAQQVFFLIVAIVTHLIFGLISLVNSDVVDFTAGLVNSDRGCAVALSVQAVMVLLAGLAAAYLTITIEKFPSHLMKWVMSRDATATGTAATASSMPHQVHVGSAPPSRGDNTSTDNQHRTPMNTNDL